MQKFVPCHMHSMLPLGKRFDNKYVLATMKHPPSQMIWGDMACCGAAGLCSILPNTTMNGPKYMKFLIKKLKLHVHVHDCAIFMLDGVPCHRSKVASSS